MIREAARTVGAVLLAIAALVGAVIITGLIALGVWLVAPIS